MTPETRKLLMSELGKAGVVARMAKTTPEQRQAIASKAGKTAWNKLTPEEKTARIQKMQDGRKLG